MALTNKNIVVIGGTSGIGLATAVQARAAGASVWAASRSEDKIQAASAAYPDIQFR
jgi:NAD(P)-dependent dehydrogenase (short-subunit alcohol dehydrogenase family)